MKWLALALGAGFVMTNAPAQAATGPRLVPVASEVQTTDQFAWRFTLKVLNPLDVGIYTDSATCQVHSEDPGETRADRTSFLPLHGLARMVPSLSAGDSGSFSLQSLATAERATLTFRYWAHTSDGTRYVDSTVVRTRPGSMWSRYRSETMTVKGKKVEYVVVPSLGGRQPSSGVLLVHGHGSNARLSIPRALELAELGYTVLAVSQPGYGTSDGPPDFIGPATMRAVDAAFDRLRRTPHVDSTRVGVWGVSSGANAAALLAARRKDVRAVVAESGIYDLGAAYRETKLAGFPETIVQEVGSDSAAWRERSPLSSHARIKSAVMFLHGAKDNRVPVGQAEAMLAALKADGIDADAKFYPNLEHALPPSARKPAQEFLQRTLQP